MVEVYKSIKKKINTDITDIQVLAFDEQLDFKTDSQIQRLPAVVISVNAGKFKIEGDELYGELVVGVMVLSSRINDDSLALHHSHCSKMFKLLNGLCKGGFFNALSLIDISMYNKNSQVHITEQRYRCFGRVY